MKKRSSDRIEKVLSWAKSDSAFASSLRLRHDLLSADSISEIVMRGLTRMLHLVPSQVAILFLYDKAGRLARRGIRGLDRDGVDIPEDWYKEEVHRVGVGLVGRAVVTSDNDRIAKPVRTRRFLRLDRHGEWVNLYSEMLNGLLSGMAVPLQGYNRPFGAIVLLNKFTAEGHRENAHYTPRELGVVHMHATSIASAISTFRRQSEFNMLANLGEELVGPSGAPRSLRDIARRAAQGLVGEYFPYSASILRVRSGVGGGLPVIARGGSDINWQHWIDEPVMSSPSTMHVVLATGEPIIVASVSEHRGALPNKTWMAQNSLETYACYPLPGKDGPVGTLSVLTRYKHQMSEADKQILAAICAILGAAVELGQNAERINKASDSIIRTSRERAGHAARAAVSASHEEMAVLLHKVKNDFVNIGASMAEALQPGSKQNILKGVKRIADDRVRELKKELSMGADTNVREPVDLNALVAESVAQERHASQLQSDGDQIEIKTTLDPELPVLSAVPGELRLVIDNLVGNAMRAVQHSRNSPKVVEVSTGWDSLRGIRCIQVTVRDNGVGIPNENRTKIFDKHFTTYAQGTGMGLYTAKRILTRYSGSVVFESQVGKGSTFRVLLPLSAITYTSQDQR